MKLRIVFSLLILLNSSSLFSQSNTNQLTCTDLLNKAKDKYNVVFNYATQDVQSINCMDSLPKQFSEFRRLLNETSGLDLRRFSTNSWVVSKNFSHKLKVVNAQNEPITNAIILGENTYSNSFGNIFLKVNKTNTSIIIADINHEDYQLTISDTIANDLVIIMKQKEIELDAVNIKTLYVNSIYLSSDNHIKVKIKKMPLLAGQTQQDAFISILNLPQINTNVESVAELNIKGGINDQNLVLWNGIRMFQNAHFFGLLSAFNENLIENITVIDNATPVEYGNALTSTIKLDFDKNIVNKNTVGVGLNALSGQLFSRIALDENTELAIALQRSFTDIFDSSTFQSYREKSYTGTDLDLFENQEIPNTLQRDDNFYYQDAQFQIKKKINEKFNIRLQGIWFQNTLDYQERSENQEIRNSNYNNENVAFGVDASYWLTKKQTIEIKSNYTQHSSQGRNNTFSGNLDTNQSNLVESYNTQLMWLNANNHNQLKLGLDFEGSVVFNRFNNSITQAFLNLGQVSNIYAGFGSYNYYKGNWNIYGGIRAAYFQRDMEWSLEPRLQVNYQLNKNFDVVLRGETKSQNFKQIIDLDQNFLGIEKRRWIVSGDSISPPLQRTSQMEAMLKWKFNKIGGYASVYFRKLKGISTNDQQFQNEGQFQDLLQGDSDIIGALYHMYYKNDWLNTWVSYAHLDEKQSFENNTFRGNNSLNHQITWGNNLTYKNWNLSLALNYHSGLPYTSIDKDNPLNLQTDQNKINFTNTNASILPEYFRVDSSLQYLLKTNKYGKLTISIGILNLTNEDNFLRRNYRLNRVNQEEIQQIDNVGLGFTTNLGILWTL